ncbi:hypothetical protein [Neorhizobium sp. JUb45]|uniref:hypothetical protein n=1 Tax=Neorhizobium sp. JUb45 TaxID=2485113 RepID=UPI001049EB44|nr:hypothetical protein [Neorhizobium sp. JUb45]TCR07283.1 hypothetical protein EDF70_1011256 [Neorhizobium sp. JUb45]
MAFSGVHVVCAYAGSLAFQRAPTQPIIGKVNWSESISSGSMTTNSAPGLHGAAGQPIFRIRSSAEVWVSVGPQPDPVGGKRFIVPAGVDYDVYVDVGDRLAWTSA